MKATKLIAIFCVAAIASMMSGCVWTEQPPAGTPHSSAAGISDRFTADADKIVDFAENRTSDFVAAHGYRNRDPFDCTWDRSNAAIRNGVMNMSVTTDGNGYKGAEYRSEKSYTYGYYSVAMQAAACSGVISSFFTYTSNPKWDEIDIEFLGDDTTKVHFNYYTGGVGNHEYVHELGFDASEGMHEYGFDWQENYIVWYVDGKAIYKADKNIPSMPQKIMMNVWNGKGADFEAWSGKLDKEKLPATARYSWVAYKGNGTGGNTSGDDNTGNQGNTGDNKPVTPTNPIAPDYITADGDKIANFSSGGSSAFYAADGWSNGGMFDCTWRNANISFGGGNMNISITREGNGYAGGEYRTHGDYSFGYFSTSMKPVKCSGVVSSLFTYTSAPRWDEIDIEFLGNDTTKVQFNYYTDGVGGHEYLYDLGFDASLSFHEYGFLWQRDSIIWYVDGKAVYKATTDIPQYAGKIMTNVWNGKGVDDWIGPFDNSKLPVTAAYKWIGYKAA